MHTMEYYSEIKRIFFNFSKISRITRISLKVMKTHWGILNEYCYIENTTYSMIPITSHPEKGKTIAIKKR